jgi:hypothetical protein
VHTPVLKKAQTKTQPVKQAKTNKQNNNNNSKKSKRKKQRGSHRVKELGIIMML